MVPVVNGSVDGGTSLLDCLECCLKHSLFFSREHFADSAMTKKVVDAANCISNEPTNKTSARALRPLAPDGISQEFRNFFLKAIFYSGGQP